MKVKACFLEKKIRKKNIINLLSADFAQRVVKFNVLPVMYFAAFDSPDKPFACWVKISADDILKYFSYCCVFLFYFFFVRKPVLTFHANCLQ